MRKLLPLLFLISLFINSCKKEEDVDNSPSETSSDNKLNDNPFIVDTLGIGKFSLNSLSIIKNKTSLRPKIGDILLSEPCLTAPFGFMVKVKSVSDNREQINCVVEYASLNEAFKELHINTTWQDSITLQQTARNELGEAASTYNFYNNKSLIPGFVINGKVKLNLSKITLVYDKEVNSKLPKYVLIKSDFDTDGSTMELSSDGESIINSLEIPLSSFHLPDFYIRVPILVPYLGIIFLPIRCVQKVYLKIGPVNLKGKAKWDLLPKVISVMGAEYKDGSWNNISTFSVNTTASPLLIGNFNPEVSIDANFTIKPVYEFSPYGADILKIFLEAPSDFSFNMQKPSPNYSLKYKFSVEAGITAKWFDGTSGTLSLSKPFFEKTLLEGNWIKEPASVSIVSGNNQFAQAGKTLTDSLIVIVKDSSQKLLSGITVSWNVSTGGGQITSSSSVTDSLGKATNSWKIGPSGSQKVTATVIKEDGTNVSGSPIAFTASISEPASVSVLSGNNQSAPIGKILSEALIVIVKDSRGQSLSGIAVTWSVTAGGGQITTSSTTTDSLGKAVNTWKLGTSGSQQVTATVKKADGTNVSGSPITFTASFSEPASVSIVSGNTQTASAETILKDPLTIVVKDSKGQLLSGIIVKWNVVLGGGKVISSSSTTDSLGEAWTYWIIGSSGTQQVTATVKKTDGTNVIRSPLSFTANISSGCGPGSSVTDIDGNKYNVIQIGNQCWMVENLKTTRYNDGVAIPNVSDDKQWYEYGTGTVDGYPASEKAAWCYYDNDVANNNIYGKLYNWHAVGTGKLAPKGWHVPTKAEWETLIAFLGGNNIAGGKMKSTSSLWNSPNTGATNSSGFSALPHAARMDHELLFGIGNYAEWWSISQDVSNTDRVWTVEITNTDGAIEIHSIHKDPGFAIRCIKD